MKHIRRISSFAAALMLLAGLDVPLRRAKGQQLPASAAMHSGMALFGPRPAIELTPLYKQMRDAGKANAKASGAQTIAKDGGVNGAFTYSADAALAAAQRSAKNTVATYQKGLNASDTKAILPLFAQDAVVEWNGKATIIGRAALARPYRKLFQENSFATRFQYDAVDVYSNSIALVRTHHLKGQTEQNLKDGSTKLDFNRELFILRRSSGDWKIIFYSFNTQPKQGVQ